MHWNSVYYVISFLLPFRTFFPWLWRMAWCGIRGDLGLCRNVLILLLIWVLWQVGHLIQLGSFERIDRGCELVLRQQELSFWRSQWLWERQLSTLGLSIDERCKLKYKILLIGDIGDDDQGAVLVLNVLLVSHQSRETDWVTVDSGVAESSQNSLIEAWISSSGQEFEELNQKLMVKVCGGELSTHTFLYPGVLYCVKTLQSIWWCTIYSKKNKKSFKLF